MKLKINDYEFDVKVSRTPEQQHQGLRGVKHLEKNEGMLFIFDEEQEVEFEMNGTFIDLDIVFIDEDKEVISVEMGYAGDEAETIIEDGVKYVLEINPGFDIKPGDEVKFEEGYDRDTPGLHVLDSDGESQAVLKGGERIFSRKNTKTIVKLANEANKLKTDAAYRKLGRKMFAYLDKQESNDKEYVESPK